MIEVADDNGEMSTLGDPGGQTIFSSKDPFQLNGDAEQRYLFQCITPYSQLLHNHQKSSLCFAFPFFSLF
jgi:hypothetical protein